MVSWAKVYARYGPKLWGGVTVAVIPGYGLRLGSTYGGGLWRWFTWYLRVRSLFSVRAALGASLMMAGTMDGCCSFASTSPGVWVPTEMCDALYLVTIVAL